MISHRLAQNFCQSGLELYVSSKNQGFPFWQMLFFLLLINGGSNLWWLQVTSLCMLLNCLSYGLQLYLTCHLHVVKCRDLFHWSCDWRLLLLIIRRIKWEQMSQFFCNFVDRYYICIHLHVDTEIWYTLVIMSLYS